MKKTDHKHRRLDSGSSVAPVESKAPGVTEAPGVTAPTAAASSGIRRRLEFLHFAVRNSKLVIGLSFVLLFLLIAIVGPYLTDHEPLNFYDALGQPPSSKYWLGTTAYGQDIYTQFVFGLRSSFFVGAVGGGIAAVIGMLVGFTAGYRGGIVDDILNMITNVFLVIPTLAVLLVLAAYVSIKGYFIEAVFIGFTSWPWAARAIRAQTFSLVSRDFIGMARLSGERSWKIIFKEIAPNMSSYLFMTFILMFGGAILTGAFLDFIGIGPANAMSLGLMMNQAVSAAALLLHYWWWFIPPGIGIMAIVGGLYVMNVGLDEVFNPKLRAM